MGNTLVRLLTGALSSVAADDIGLATPDEFEQVAQRMQPSVTIFLYRVAVEPHTRNAPRRRFPDGKTQRPPLPLELSYLITPWSRDKADEQLIVGEILKTMYDNAELGTSDLVGDTWAPDDSVQLVLDTLPLEDHYRIWDTTSQPYRLSLTYVARIIRIEAAIRAPAPLVVDAQLRARQD